MENVNYERGFSKPRYLCRWWLKSRKIDDSGLCELYTPWWAKPLDFIWKLIFGNPELRKEI